VELRSGEQVIFQGHPSWRAILGFYIQWAAAGAVAAGIAALVTLIAGDFQLAVVILVFLLFVVFGVFVGLVKRIATTYSITNQRLHIKRGIISRKLQQTRIERVQNVNINQSVIQRILRVGKVDFDTAGTDDSDFTFDGVSQPERVMKAVEQAQHEASQGGGGLDDGLGGPAQPPQQPPQQQQPPPAQPAPPAQPPPTEPGA
jgi:uncharacterized membrane protein YdbT with pleckstrin-like domain